RRRLVCLRVGLRRVGLWLPRGVGFPLAFLARRAAVGLVPARSFEDERRRGEETARSLSAVRALLERLIAERLHRGKAVSAVVAAVVVDRHATRIIAARWRAGSTSFTYAIITVPLEIALALVIAYLLFQKMRGRGIYRTVYYLPYVTSFVAAAVVFNWLFHPQYGLVNALIGVIGIGPQRWLDEPSGVLAMVASAFAVTRPDWAAGPSMALVVGAIVTVWPYLGYQIGIFLAGLSNISPEYYEAARLDGASERQIFTKITLPLLSPTTFFVFTIASIGALRSFDTIFVLTGGGPLDTTRTVTLLLFRTAF